MNKVYQTKFNIVTGITIACSELVRRACKSTATVVCLVSSALAIPTSAFALDCTANADRSYLVGQNIPSCNNIKAANVSQSGNAGFYILTRSRLHEKLDVGDTILTANVNGNYTGLANQYTYGVSGGSINAGNLNFTITNNGQTMGLATHHNVDLTAKNVELNITDNYTHGSNSSGNVASYSILAGSFADAGEKDTYNGKYSTITVDKLKINQTAKGGKTQPILNNGIRAMQGAYENSGNGSAGQVIVNDDLDMTLTGNRSIGIYVSGNPTNHDTADKVGASGQLTPKVILKGGKNTITINKGSDTSALKWDSAAIKLGKTRNTGEGAGILESYGELTIDTTNALEGSGIKMIRNSLLKADYENSTTIIKTGGYALEIGTHDDANSTGQFEQAASHGVKASFKNAIFTTTGTSADPVINGSIGRKDLIFVDQGQVDTVLSFTGDKTDLTANDAGYIINVSGNYTAPNYQFFSNTYDSNGTELGHDAYQGSSVTFNASGKGSMTGLVYKGLVKVEEGEVLDTDVNTVLNINLNDNFTWNLKPNGTSNIAKFDKVELNNGATINGAFADVGSNEFILQGDVISNGGIINLDNHLHGKYNDILTIDGNYMASGIAMVKMNTLWNNPIVMNDVNEQSDILRITGMATGVTKVIPIGSTGQENIIDGNIRQIASIINTDPVIYVGTSSNEQVFQGVAHTNGATEVQLAKRKTANGDEYYWTMKSGNPIPPTPTPTPPPIPSVPLAPPIDSAKAKPILSSPVAGYVAMAKVNQEQGLLSIGTLHERRGQDIKFNSSSYNDNNKYAGETWGRILGKHLKQNGKTRLNYDTNIYGIQLGHDLINNIEENGSHNHVGLYLAYTKAYTDFSDKYRAEHGRISHSKRTGKGKSESVNLGLTNSYFSIDNSYFDLVGQFSYLRNKYEARNGNNPHAQNGLSMALSAEAGHAFIINQSDIKQNYWLIEPQVQMVYQYVDLDSFKDKYRKVDQNGQDLLRGRIGVRLAYNQSKDHQTTTLYAIGNIWHDFIKPNDVDIGRDSLREKYASTWGELGLGIKAPLGQNMYLYGDTRYEHDFGSTKRQGYRGNIGIEHKW
ncbi:autotransporter outer membrane beta-barrel domain-containing protein [Gilliamella intestini]|uniref:Outer membrane autotransporter barrel domain-containing protein n=1 Tax=Gilliamella intestini TaxID=1798183 RepID=A0A1C4BP49_9GAMM|nr:autotransporter outer membrane beta-barrel domain-containing protein [Gilliamella intestini]SCC08600.1 outer membrane autotransporter barrel domain-containing protein [Gilliamella intestini]